MLAFFSQANLILLRVNPRDLCGDIQCNSFGIAVSSYKFKVRICMSQPGCTLVEGEPSPRSPEKLRPEVLGRRVLGAISPLKSREDHPYYLDSRTVGTALYWISHINNAKGWCKPRKKMDPI